MLGGDFQRWMLRSRRSAAKGGFDIETEKLVVEYASTLSRCAPGRAGHRAQSLIIITRAHPERRCTYGTRAALSTVGKASLRVVARGCPITLSTRRHNRTPAKPPSMPPKKSNKALAKLQKQIQRVEDESVKQQQRNRHLRLDVERLGTVLERRTRERDVAYAELETILERRPSKLKTVQTLTKEHDKLAKRLTKDARANAASFTETASTPQATDLWELRVAEEEYQLEVARLKPLADRLARLDFALAEEEDEDARDRLGVERAAILSKMRGDDFWEPNQGGGNGQFG